MSFSRAKRFDYKPPDLDISPADYDISSNLFEKGVVIPKCPRFKDKKDQQEIKPCCRSNCCREKPTCGKSSPSNVRKLDPIPEQNCTYNKTASSRTSMNSTQRKLQQTDRKIEKSATYVHEIIKNFERLARGPESSQSNSPVTSAEEFIDDDYHSYTSSEELDSLKKVEEYEFNEVCRAYKDLVLNKTCSGTSNSAIEDALLEKMDKLEQSMESMKQDVNHLNTQFQIEELERSRNKEQMKIENMKELLEKSLERYSPKNRIDIREMIVRAIENLNREFEHKRISILKDSEERIRRLIEDIYISSNTSGEDMKRLCRNTAINLTKRLDSTMKSMYSSLPDAKSPGLMIEQKKECTEDKHGCFNYENVCKILSEQLQLTQDEKEGLELENLDMTLKCSETQQALEAQANVIDQLHFEIAALKEYINNKRKR